MKLYIAVESYLPYWMFQGSDAHFPQGLAETKFHECMLDTVIYERNICAICCVQVNYKCVQWFIIIYCLKWFVWPDLGANSATVTLRNVIKVNSTVKPIQATVNNSQTRWNVPCEEKIVTICQNAWNVNNHHGDKINTTSAGFTYWWNLFAVVFHIIP